MNIAKSIQICYKKKVKNIFKKHILLAIHIVCAGYNFCVIM